MEGKSKQVVHYRKLPQNYIQVGVCASVVVMDHPHFEPGVQVYTSTVQSYDKETGEFHTNNSIYKPEE